MLKYWEVTETTFNERKRSGLTLKECLEGKCVYDHKGNKFKTKREMFKYWKVKEVTFKNRKKSGWTLEECLEGKGDNYVYDHKGNKFKNESEMARYWGVDPHSFGNRKRYGWTLEECLSIMPRSKQNIKNIKIDNHLEIKKRINTKDELDYFYCVYDDKKEMILTYDEILDYYKKYVLAIA